MSARIDRVWPDPAEDLDDDELLAAYAFPSRPWLRMNFVTSLDGAATRAGRSGGLGGEGDRRVFELLRRQADVILIGAGTVRTEGYGAMRLAAEAVQWRAACRMREHPVFAIVSRGLDLDPGSAVFTEAPTRPLVYTVTTAAPARRRALSAVADVVDAGTSVLDPPAVRDDLVSRGLARIHSEGGPSLFGAFLAAGAVDELCLTVAPALDGGEAGRIARSAHATPTAMRPSGILRSGDELLLRYVRASAGV